MIRTGFFKDDKVEFPDNASGLEIIATIKHINGSTLPAAKMLLQLIDEYSIKEEYREFINKAIKYISDSIEVEKQAVEYSFKNQIS